ncbi:MAG: 2-phosphosulfolactate phosphatase [Hyphomicrobiaceae bacterium]
MDVKLDSLLAGAERATGTAIVIDVFRAFTTAAVAFARGADKIIMIANVEEALRLRRDNVGQICMGEVDGRAPAGFDLGNSPYEATQLDVAGKTIIQRTSAGTQGIVAASHATRLYAGSLVTASATARAIQQRAPEHVCVIAMGDHGLVRTDEDELCALHLRNLLQGRRGNPQAVRDVILSGARAVDFEDPDKPHLHQKDLEIALDVDRYDFAVHVSLEDGRPTARAERATGS